VSWLLVGKIVLSLTKPDPPWLVAAKNLHGKIRDVASLANVVLPELPAKEEEAPNGTVA